MGIKAIKCLPPKLAVRQAINIKLGTQETPKRLQRDGRAHGQAGPWAAQHRCDRERRGGHGEGVGSPITDEFLSPWVPYSCSLGKRQ